LLGHGPIGGNGVEERIVDFWAFFVVESGEVL